MSTIPAQQVASPDSAGPRAAAPTRPPSVLVIVPTYNERENLPGIARRLRRAAPEADMLVVDDGSPDGTGAIADGLAASDPRVHVLHRGAKAGLGGAYVAGFGWALARGYDVVVEMDADGSHAPEELHRLLAAVDAGADLALGSRYMPGGRLENWPRHRELLSRWGNRYARIALGVPLHDITGGYRAFRRNALEQLALGDVASQGYCFQVELAWRGERAGLVLVEVPITFTERARGTSKMDGSIVREALWRITRWGVRGRLGRR